MKYILSPIDVASSNSKIQTLQALQRCGLPSLDVKIISKDAFSQYYKNDGFSPNLKLEITSLLKSLFKKNKFISIRTSVEKEAELLLPRSKSIDSIPKALFFIKKTWDYFISASASPEDFGVSLLVHEFVPSFASGTVGDFPDQNRKIIEATYGIWEGIQSNLHDVYVFDKNNKKIIKKTIPEKDTALFPDKFGKWNYSKVKQKLRKRQVVSDIQILEIIRQASLLEKIYDFPRIEFIIKETKEQDSGKAVLFWHITSSKENFIPHFYKLIPFKEKTKQKIYYAGDLLIVKGIEDFSKLRQVEKKDVILFLGDEIIAKRDLFAIQLLASLAKEKNWPVVYKGGLLTHINIILREYGVRVFSINQSVNLKDKIQIIEDLA